MKSRLYVLVILLLWMVSGHGVPNNGSRQDLLRGLEDLNQKLSVGNYVWPKSVSAEKQNLALFRTYELLELVAWNDETLLQNSIDPTVKYLNMCQTNVMNYARVREQALSNDRRYNLDRAQSDRNMMLQSLEMCLMPWLLR